MSHRGVWELDAFGRIGFYFGHVADHLHVDGWSRKSRHNHYHPAADSSTLGITTVSQLSGSILADVFD